MPDRPVTHNAEKNRFEIALDGSPAMLQYMHMGSQIIFTHTEVPEAHEGEGLASQLARTGLQYAREEDLRVVPLCPFVKAYMQRHRDEYEDLG